SILMLDEKEYSFDPFRLTKRGMEVKQHERSILFGAWGDGYTSTVNWLTDLIGWQIYANRVKSGNDLKRLTGIVLLDEIELNLHPSWQRRIIGLLREQFPCVQFIATSHSPLCALGMTDLKDKECKIILLRNDFENVEVIEGRPPRGRRADQVLTSYLFGLETSTDDNIRKEIEKYARLSAKKRQSESDIKELKRLRKILDDTLGSKETELQTVVSNAMRGVLQKMPITKLFDKQSINYEIKLQLKRLLDFND
ncbi:MAG: AAA family ATPase, partial [Candidatus Bathyarchaeota archaeon]